MNEQDIRKKKKKKEKTTSNLDIEENKQEKGSSKRTSLQNTCNGPKYHS